MKLTALSLFLLILISSCTVEKRLHNRGWNVQWRNHYKVDKDQNAVSDHAKIELDQAEVKINSVSPKLIDPELEIISEEFEINRTVEDEFTDATETFQRETKVNVKESKKRVSKNTHVSTSRKRVSGESSRIAIPVILLILGTLSIFLALSLYLTLNGSGTIGYLISILGIGAFGIVGLVLLIIGLSSLIVELGRRS